MSVYTCITQQQLDSFIKQYSLGKLFSFSGIQAGIENTNYHVTTSEGDFILTIFESLSSQALPCYLNLLNHLYQNQFPAPRPYDNNFGESIGLLSSKPAVFFNRLPGHSVNQPTDQQCHEIGLYLGQLHKIASASHFDKGNDKNLAGCQSLFNNVFASISDIDKDILHSELQYQQQFFSLQHELSIGLIHADLFRDNVLINHGKVSGILDFYNACRDYLLYDIAVTVNDWCIEDEKLNHSKLQSLLSGYQSINPLKNAELIHLPVFLRLAALRFYLSRLEHQLNPKAGSLTLQKDPLVFRRILQQYQVEEGMNDLCLSA